jgi:phosphoribosylanthranilate isomerase
MNNTTRIKICGIRTPDIAEAAIEAGAEMIGVVLVERSPRYVTAAEARTVVQAVGDRAEVVALVKDREAADVRDLAERIGVRAVQWYGSVRPDDVMAVAPLGVIKPLAFDADSIARDIDAWDDVPGIRALLIDTPCDLGGGSGRTFDWALLHEAIGGVVRKRPIMLAGGLTPENVAEAVATIRPWAVDVSSGVESSRGVKDAGLIKTFCEAARGTSA